MLEGRRIHSARAREARESPFSTSVKETQSRSGATDRFSGMLHPCKSEFHPFAAQLHLQFARKLVALLQQRFVGNELVLAELPHGVVEHLLFVRKLEIHQSRPS